MSAAATGFAHVSPSCEDERVKRLWELTLRYWFDAAIVVGLGIGLATTVMHQNGSKGPEGPLWFDILAVIAFMTPLLARRRFPFKAPLAVFVVLGASSFVDNRLVPDAGTTFLAALAALFLIGMHRERTQAIAGLVLVQGIAVVVGHSVSVMTVQASAARRLLRPHQEKEREALLVVEQTGREALAEMRRMVGVLRRPEEAPALAPQPSLQHLDKLVQQAREAGLPVELRIEGTPEQLPSGVDLTAYRLVQEGLTNAVKHANAEHAEVLVRYSDGHVEVTVSDDGPGGGDGDKGGHGLVGMRERVSVYGGELEAGPRPEGGYRLRARLPVSA